MEKIPYTRRIPALSDNVLEYIIADQPVLSGMWLFIQHFACRDQDNDITKITVGRGKGLVPTNLFEEEPNPLTDRLYHSEKGLYFVPEGENMLAVFEGTVVGDHLDFYLDGYLTPKVLSRQVFKKE